MVDLVGSIGVCSYIGCREAMAAAGAERSGRNDCLPSKALDNVRCFTR